MPLYYPYQPYYSVGNVISNEQTSTSQQLPQGGMQSTGYSNTRGIYEQSGNGISSTSGGVAPIETNSVSTVTTTTSTIPTYGGIPSLAFMSNGVPLMYNNYMSVQPSLQVVPVGNYNPLGIGSFIINNNGL